MNAETIAGLATMPEAFEGVFRQIPAELLDWKPESWDGMPGETFSALEQACHLRDIEVDGYHLRFRRMVGEDKPSPVSIDSYALARERFYGGQDPAEAMAAFRRARLWTVAMLGGLSKSDWRRLGDFAEYGSVTTAGLLHLLLSHDQQHLACMQWLAAIQVECDEPTACSRYLRSRSRRMRLEDSPEIRPRVASRSAAAR
ncbi:MAG: DinB family protein [Proteobacteria bacterium]|nr:DinB family protein [Pseudomonadota bacterium]MBI3497375.1 DinB family protein [Pseudomonadota bacterium]